MPASPALLQAALLLLGCRASPPPEAAPPAVGPGPHTFEVVNAYPHDPKAYTQGLLFADGTLYESTGQRGESTVRQVALESGEVLRQRAIDPRYFAEGLALHGDRLVQLTLSGKIILLTDKKTFEPLGEVAYDATGWGLASDGERLIASDGTAKLRFLDPQTLAVTGEVLVREGKRLVRGLNELEMVQGELYANIMRRDRIARIDPSSGQVLGWIDLTDLLPAADRPGTDVLNGIAWDAAGGRLFVTGKLWPRLFEIRLAPARTGSR